MTASTLSPLELAQESARIMWAEDTATRHVGMELIDVAPGRARLSLTVRDEFTNGHGMCHGGYIFMLADSAFAFACNSHNQRAVAASAAIDFVAAAQRGDVLTADCAEQSRGGRSGLYDTRVTDQNGRLIALFRGRSATIRGRFIEETPT
ncbi:MAG: hydroxyphenylacetyl-CoA thioesterase PaaI [Betaproteobacteria bacterium]|nr:hydroxyphenylacetyl-CoA thioesterase PaaI [Betaproteobacteria bacterium]